MAQQSSEISFGSDSFLDVMANMVGILIVLVLIAVMCANHGSSTDEAQVKQAKAEVTSLADEATSLERDVKRLAGETAEVAQLTSARHLERDALALAATAQEHDLEDRRRGLDEKSREQFDLRRALDTAQANLEKVKFDLADKSADKRVEATKIETYPTPISHVVYGREAHFQLLHGRIALVPMDDLVKLFEEDARQNIQRLSERSQVVETIGPLGGFRLRYTLERLDVPTRMITGEGNGVTTRLSYGFTLIPVSSDLGETIDAALAPDSEFRRTIATFRKDTTITLWTYPDSFALYRALKKDLYARGFVVAARPMPEGQPIGGSPTGSKSAAQ
jgi:hypothetical protein